MFKFLFVLLFSIQVFGRIQETPNLQQCLEPALKATTDSSPADVVFVFDIDNTVLKLKQNFGSVQWYHWQQKLIQDQAEGRIANTIDDLLAAQGSIYQLSAAETPEASTAQQIAELQRQGYPVLFHTSRNLDTRGATQRELTRNGLLPLTKTLGPDQGFPGSFTYQVAMPNQRPVSFQDGVYMSAGQDKGVWLGLLFEKLNYHPRHIIFVDDEIHNLVNVERALDAKTDLTLCRYGQVDPIVQVFNTSDKRPEIELWNEFANLARKLK
jgi:hypothetical protein